MRSKNPENTAGLRARTAGTGDRARRRAAAFAAAAVLMAGGCTLVMEPGAETPEAEARSPFIEGPSFERTADGHRIRYTMHFPREGDGPWKAVVKTTAAGFAEPTVETVTLTRNRGGGVAVTDVAFHAEDAPEDGWTMRMHPEHRDLVGSTDGTPAWTAEAVSD